MNQTCLLSSWPLWVNFAQEAAASTSLVMNAYGNAFAITLMHKKYIYIYVCARFWPMPSLLYFASKDSLQHWKTNTTFTIPSTVFFSFLFFFVVICGKASGETTSTVWCMCGRPHRSIENQNFMAEVFFMGQDQTWNYSTHKCLVQALAAVICRCHWLQDIRFASHLLSIKSVCMSLHY